MVSLLLASASPDSVASASVLIQLGLERVGLEKKKLVLEFGQQGS